VTRTLAFLIRFQSLFGLIAVYLVSVWASPINRQGQNVFLGADNQLNIVRFASENGIIAVGLTLVILTGGIDLSVGSVLALCGVTAAMGLMKLGLSAPAAIALALAVGALAGTISGVVTTGLRLQSFVTTLAMMTVARGLATLLTQGTAVPLAYGAAQAPPVFKSMFAGQLHLGGVEVPVQILYFLVVGITAAVVLQRTSFGRRVYAVGSSEHAARLSGVAVSRVKVIVFAVLGLLVGLASLLHIAQGNQGSPIDGDGYELDAIAAVVVGGTSLSGGAGSVLGSMTGALILSILNNILQLKNYPSDVQMIAKGVIIVLAVVLQRSRR